MTPAAANVGFGYWSHDLGGYNIYCPRNGSISPCVCETVIQPCNLTKNACAKAEGELYTRWLQFGALSPIFRTHCSHCDRRIWSYPEPFYTAMAGALKLRRFLQPYLYAAAAAAAAGAEPVAVHPLYHEWPLEEEAFSYAGTQYLLGGALLAAPVAAPAGFGTPPAVWLPPGAWAPWAGGGAPASGPAVLPTSPVALDAYRLWARVGAVVAAQPTTPAARSTAVWVLFVAGAAGGGEGARYEDDGGTTRGEGAWTTVAHSGAPAGSGGATEVWVGPMVGSFQGAPQTRRHVLQVRGGTRIPARVACNGAALPQLPQPVAGEEEAYATSGWWVALAPRMFYDGLIVVADELPVEVSLSCAIFWE